MDVRLTDPSVRPAIRSTAKLASSIRPVAAEADISDGREIVQIDKFCWHPGRQRLATLCDAGFVFYAPQRFLNFCAGAFGLLINQQ